MQVDVASTRGTKWASFSSQLFRFFVVVAVCDLVHIIVTTGSLSLDANNI